MLWQMQLLSNMDVHTGKHGLINSKFKQKQTKKKHRLIHLHCYTMNDHVVFNMDAEMDSISAINSKSRAQSVCWLFEIIRCE